MTDIPAEPRSFFAVFLGEPLELIKAQPHQLLISTASVALMGSFAGASGILDPMVGYLLAIGIEWAYFRGLASDSKAPTVWGSILNWSACGIVILWGMLWVGRFTGALVETEGGWWLAAAHVIPIAWLSLCSAQTHRAAMVADVAQRRAADEAERQRQADADERQRLADEAERAYQRDLQARRDALQLETEQRYRLMKIDEEQRAIRSANRSQQRSAHLPNSAAGTATNSGANSTREQLRAQIVNALREQPGANKTALARTLGIGRTLLYELIEEAKQAGEL